MTYQSVANSSYVSTTPLCSVTSMLCSVRVYGFTVLNLDGPCGLLWALKGSGIDADDIRAEAWRDMKLLLLLSLSWTVMWDSLNQSWGRKDGEEEPKVIQKSQLDRSLLKLMSIELVMPSNQLILCPSPSPLTFNLSQHQSLFKWVSFSHQVAKILEFQLQHQSFQ